MEKGKIFTGVLAVGLVASLVGNVYLWNSLNQKDTEYIATMANLEEELTQSKENQTTLQQQLEQTKADLDKTNRNKKEELPEFYEEMVYNEETGIYEPVYIPVGGSDTDPSKEGNPLDEMTPEEFDKWMLDTSDAPKPGDITPQKPTEEGNGNTNNQGNTDNQGNTGGNSGGSSPLTPEQQAELQRILDNLPGHSGGPQGGSGTGGGTGSGIADGSEINWD